RCGCAGAGRRLPAIDTDRGRHRTLRRMVQGLLRGDGMTHNRRISVIGLGYVGLPVAVAFGKREPVVGFDINPARVAELRRGEDRTNEVEPADLAAARINYTCD